MALTLKKLYHRMNAKPIAFNPVYVDLLNGDFVTGCLLSQISYWYTIMQDEFWKEDDDWIRETRISRKRLKRAKAVLKTYPWITIKRKQLSSGKTVSHYDLDIDKMLEAVANLSESPFGTVPIGKVPKGQSAGKSERDHSIGKSEKDHRLYSKDSTTDTTRVDILIKKIYVPHEEGVILLVRSQKKERKKDSAQKKKERWFTAVVPELIGDVPDYKEIFNSFRKAYPGAKGGLDKEWTRFKKKAKMSLEDQNLLILRLSLILEYYMAYMQIEVDNGRQPFYKNISTWINNACWDDEYPFMPYEQWEESYMDSTFKDAMLEEAKPEKVAQFKYDHKILWFTQQELISYNKQEVA